MRIQKVTIKAEGAGGGEEEEQEDEKRASTVVLMQSVDRATNSHFAICGAALCSTLYGSPRPAEVSLAFFIRRHQLSRPSTAVGRRASRCLESKAPPVSGLSGEILEAAHKAEDRASALRGRRRETRENEGAGTRSEERKRRKTAREEERRGESRCARIHSALFKGGNHRRLHRHRHHRRSRLRRRVCGIR